MDQTDNAKQYARIKYYILFADILLGVLFLLAYQIFISSPVAYFSRSVTGFYFGSLLIYLAVYGLISYGVFFPLHFYSSYRLEHRFSLSRQTFGAWLKDEAKKAFLQGALFLSIMTAWYAILRYGGTMWWAYTAAGYLVFSVVFTRLMPTLLIPLFYKYTAIERPDLAGKIVAIAERAGIKALGVFGINLGAKTRKANAALVGIGASRRVILSDTLLSNFTDDEIVSVAAHEFGHHALGHIGKLIVFSCCATALGFYGLSLFMNFLVAAVHAGGIYDIRLFPVLMLIFTLGNLFFMPVFSACSRRFERQADLYCIRLTGNASSFVSAMDKLASLNLADRNPPALIKYLFYDHPTIEERINMAKGIER
ncbi:MAG: M48 family metallopeptidase [Candidatus Omnitrophica bacterium]|nr:M48 family metallopeptidase [Candidatus Omnitrophota bacterium]